MPPPSPTEEAGPFGYLDEATPASDFAVVQFQIKQALAKVQTATPVKIVSIDAPVSGAAFGFLSVQPLVSQITPDGKPMDHGVINKIPYFRVQGGASAIVIDPEPGDMGILVSAHRDISALKSSLGKSLPGSRRRFDLADGMFFGGMLNAVPTQTITFLPGGAGITIKSPMKITLEAPEIDINSDDVKINGTSLHHNTKNVGDTHTHPVTGSTTGVPNA